MPVSTHPAAAHDPLVATPRRAATASPQTLLTVSSPLALWHLLSLDAPTVAALWVFFIARTSHVALPWTAPTAMFLAVWILYAIDRLLDARATRPGTLEARHYFHASHARTFVIAIALATPVLALLIRDIPPAAIRLYLLLGTLLLAWLLLIHLPPATARLPKELAVGIFFPAAVFIPTVARAPWLRPVLLPEVILFAAVCSLNCLYIFAWEHTSSAQDAHWTTRWAARNMVALTLTTIVGAVAVIGFGLRSTQVGPWHLAIVPAMASTLSAALLLQLNHSRSQLSGTHLRAAADLCLLTPLLLLPVLK